MPVDSKSIVQIIPSLPYACALVVKGVMTEANQEFVDLVGLGRCSPKGLNVLDVLATDFVPVWQELVARSGAEPVSSRVRLAARLTPVELSVTRVGPDSLLLGVRNLESEYHYSAMAGAPLTHDQVTALPNRNYLLHQLDKRVQAPQRLPLAVVGLWIDDLAEVADSHGDQAVERVVKEVAERLQNRLRSPDILGRYDNAGFLGLLTSDVPTDHLIEIAQRLRDEVAFPVAFGGGLVSFTASVAVGSITTNRPSTATLAAKIDDAAIAASSGEISSTETLNFS